MSLSVRVRARLGAFRLDAEFEAPDGITALFGPSGSGKTSTLRCIAGLTRPDVGRIEVGGRLLFDSAERVDVPARARRVGYVFQQYALLPHLTVGQNIRYGLHDRARAEQDGRATELLELMGLAGYEARRPGDLSGGEQQRVALARALAPGPVVLLLDEPFAALDTRVRHRLRDELRRLHAATGVPTVLVTHDLAEVRQLSDRVVVYREGRVVASGATGELLDDSVPAGEDGWPSWL